MFIKSKICFTVLVIYEIAAITLLHFQRTCDAMFSTGFCDGNFKYFAGAIAVPLLAYLIWMWIREIIHARCRHRFISRAKHLVGNFASAVHEKLGNISSQDMERILTMAILFGIKRYSDRHPGLRRTIGEIIGVKSGDEMDFEYDMDTENVVASQKRGAARRRIATKSAQATTKKKK
ncbi:MAG: hypothetical protein IJO18_04635 [Alphaproteobacteria bacterium]|nr:hypothetical protein [Alphaproteobacteria bacterium]